MPLVIADDSAGRENAGVPRDGPGVAGRRTSLEPTARPQSGGMSGRVNRGQTLGPGTSPLLCWKRAGLTPLRRGKGTAKAE